MEAQNTEQIEAGNSIQIEYDSAQAKRLMTDTFTVVSVDERRGEIVEIKVERDGTTYTVATGNGPFKANIQGRNRAGNLYDVGTPVEINA